MLKGCNSKCNVFVRYGKPKLTCNGSTAAAVAIYHQQLSCQPSAAFLPCECSPWLLHHGSTTIQAIQEIAKLPGRN
eukprot:1310628-Amphidinium_carterae.1